MPRLPVRWLPMRLERLRGLWRLRRLLPVLGTLRLVLDRKTLSRHRPTRIRGLGLLSTQPIRFICGTVGANNSLSSAVSALQSPQWRGSLASTAR
jgi:hypothetical protein